MPSEQRVGIPARLMRIVVDANVWVSAVLTPDGPPGQLIRALGEDRFDLATCEPIIQEVADVLARRRIAVKYGITAEHIDRVVALIRERGELVSVTGALHLCRVRTTTWCSKQRSLVKQTQWLAAMPT